MDFVYIIGGLIGLIIGGEYLVRGAVALAQNLRISPMVIGLTLVGFGTSIPELVTSVQAAMIGAPGIAVGNVVGSNIANILLILGCAALIMPLTVPRRAFGRDGTVLIAATGLCLGVVLFGAFGRLIGAGLLAFLLGYLIMAILSGDAVAETDLPRVATAPLWPMLAMIAGGLVVTVFAAKFLVQGAVAVAADLGVSETVIGLTIVAIGTSMPELVTSVVAARRGQVDVALGNIIGSNIFNVLGILGATAMISPFAVPSQIVAFDIWVMVAATVALCTVAVTGWRITRGEGGALMISYVGYLSYLVWMAST